MTHPTLRGKLLIAAPDLVDPNFFHSVIFLLEHDKGGALGLVLNRPTCVSLTQVMPKWKTTAVSSINIFQGGPIRPRVLIGLASTTGNTEIDARKPILDSVEVISIHETSPTSNSEISALRVYSGYSGWTEGQLDSEINMGSWFTTPASPADLFEINPSRLWFRLLHAYHGKWPWRARNQIDPSRN